MSTVTEVKKAIVKACMSEGIEDIDVIGMVTAQALMGLSKMSVAGYKAHISRRRNTRRYRSKR